MGSETNSMNPTACKPADRRNRAVERPPVQTAREEGSDLPLCAGIARPQFVDQGGKGRKGFAVPFIGHCDNLHLL